MFCSPDSYWTKLQSRYPHGTISKQICYYITIYVAPLAQVWAAACIFVARVWFLEWHGRSSSSSGSASVCIARFLGYAVPRMGSNGLQLWYCAGLSTLDNVKVCNQPTLAVVQRWSCFDDSGDLKFSISAGPWWLLYATQNRSSCWWWWWSSISSSSSS